MKKKSTINKNKVEGAKKMLDEKIVENKTLANKRHPFTRLLFLLITLFIVLTGFFFVKFSYDSVVEESLQLKTAQSDLSYSVYQIEGFVSKSIGGVSASQLLTNADSVNAICNNLSYEIPYRQFEYSVSLGSDSLRLLRDCDGTANLMYQVAYNHKDSTDEAIVLTEFETTRLNNSTSLTAAGLNAVEEYEIDVFNEVYMESAQAILALSASLSLFTVLYDRGPAPNSLFAKLRDGVKS